MPKSEAKLLAINQGAIIKRVKFCLPKKHLVEIFLKEFSSGLSRHVFDDFLLTMVKEKNKDGFVVAIKNGVQLKAKIVVGCVGAHSIMQSTLTNTHNPILVSFLL